MRARLCDDDWFVWACSWKRGSEGRDYGIAGSVEIQLSRAESTAYVRPPERPGFLRRDDVLPDRVRVLSFVID